MRSLALAQPPTPRPIMMFRGAAGPARAGPVAPKGVLPNCSLGEPGVDWDPRSTVIDCRIVRPKPDGRPVCSDHMGVKQIFCYPSRRMTLSSPEDRARLPRSVAEVAPRESAGQRLSK